MATRPILVCMVWRGGERFERALRSIHASRRHFSRVVLSVTSEPHSADMRLAKAAQTTDPSIEVICTGQELSTMQHQNFWIDYLITSGARPSDWVYWLAYDDEVRLRGIEAIASQDGSWPLQPGTAYFGPWAMRHEHPDRLWAGDQAEPLESWTSFSSDGPTRLPVTQWIADQLRQPTYMQMSGSVNELRSFIDLKESRPRKRRPMRIEMAVACAPGTTYVEEFSEPVSIIYGRSNSDRANYGSAARTEDVHLAIRLARYGAGHLSAVPTITRTLTSTGLQGLRAAAGLRSLPSEEWRVRGSVER